MHARAAVEAPVFAPHTNIHKHTHTHQLVAVLDRECHADQTTDVNLLQWGVLAVHKGGPGIGHGAHLLVLHNQPHPLLLCGQVLYA